MLNLIKPTAPIRPPKGHDPSVLRRPNLPYVYAITAFVCLGSFLFGWDQGVMSMIVADDRWLDLMKPGSDWSVGFVISIYNIGCIIGAMTIGYFADACGRERTLSIVSVVFISGALLQAVSYSIEQMTTGRFILGLGVGAYSGGVPLYISEISPASIRGRVGGIMLMILCFGEMVVFFIDYGFYLVPSADWWRYPLAIQVIPALVLAVGCWFWVPPSPRWLVAEARYEDALEVLTRLHGTTAAEAEIKEIRESVEGEAQVTQLGWSDMFRGPVLRVTLLGVGIQFLQQITGTNSIFYYTPQLFKTAGLDADTANRATAGVGVVLFISAWIPIFTFDRFGRKTWLQIGLVGMFGALIGIAVLQRHAISNPDDKMNYAIVLFPYIFYTFFNMSWSSGSWTYASEIFPMSLRAKGNALCSASLWISCFITAQVTPPIVSAISWGLYLILAAWCVVAFIFVRYAMVETRGRSLEEMAALFGIEEDPHKHDEGRTERQGLLETADDEQI